MNAYATNLDQQQQSKNMNISSLVSFILKHEI